MNRRKKQNTNKIIYGIITLILVLIAGYFSPDILEQVSENQLQNEIIYTVSSTDLESIPEYSNSPYIILNDNKPEFTEEELKTSPFESYSKLDSLGRCGVAMANIGLELMPTADEERESISSVEPTGWINKKYEIVDGGYLYNRCHLIGYQLTAENANERIS